MEIEIDLWEIIDPLLPLLEEIDRLERQAAGLPPSEAKEEQDSG